MLCSIAICDPSLAIVQQCSNAALRNKKAGATDLEISVLFSIAEKGDFKTQSIGVIALKPKSALYKSRLKTCIFLHFLLFFVMLAKLSEDILDRMDIFILELEELFIPKPMPFEYLWTGSIIFAIIGLRALSRNRLSSLNSYAAGTVVLGICPLLFAAIWFYSDVAEYAEKKQEAEIEKWQGIPVGLWWYGFITVAVQVHLYSLFFAFKLIKIWRVKLKRA
ncbi:protein jagunal [Trichonephila clavipes]|nr:protein jagunal [Trichonephila clavipes]